MLETKIPATKRDGVLYVQVTDFRRHRDDLILNKLPKHNRFVVTVGGEPKYRVQLPPVELLERVDFSANSPHKMTRYGVLYREGVPYTQMTTWRRDRSAVDTTLARGEDRVVVCWRGWPDFQVSPPRDSRPVDFSPVVDREDRRKKLEIRRQEVGP